MPAIIMTLLSSITKKALDNAPICFVFVAFLGVGAWVFADQTFAKEKDMQVLVQTIESGFSKLGTRMDVSDAEAVVRNTETQIRDNEQTIADIQLGLSGLLDQNSEAARSLRTRVFTTQQKLNELRDDLIEAQLSVRTLKAQL